MDASQEARTREVIGLFLRLSLGLLFFIYGLNKLTGGMQYFADYVVSQFDKTWIPKILLYPYGYIYPWVEMITGFALIVGFMTRRFLVVMGVCLLFLQFGQLVLSSVSPESAIPTVAQIANYILILAAALWTIRDDPYSLDGLRKAM